MNTVNSDRILESLRNGGLRISGRRTGKTRALCQLAHELKGEEPANTDAVIIVPMKEYFCIVEDSWRELYGDEPVPEMETARGANSLMISASSRRALIDEWFECVKLGLWPGFRFRAAVATPPFMVEVIPGLSPHAISQLDRSIAEMGEAAALRELGVVESREQLGCVEKSA